MSKKKEIRVCPAGHKMIDRNLMLRQGRKRCRRCHRDKQRIRSAAVRAAERARRPPRPCEGCGQLVEQVTHKRRFCSKACGARHRRRKRKELAGIASGSG